MLTARSVCALGLLGALALALSADDEAAQKEAAQKELGTAVANLKALGLGVHNFCDANEGRLPDDIADKDGRYVLSWRVALLPLIGEEKLFKQFKLDEPWDGPNNKKLIDQMPKLYAPARGKAKAGETFYQRFVGKGTLWPEKGAYTLAQIADGTSNTALIVESGAPVTWTRPADLTFNAKAPLPGLGGPFAGDFHTLMGDGSVLLFKKGCDQDTLKLVITPDDGTAIDIDKLLKK
ncbi:MAG TPA: DUF1559 domain-containing protein [Gemmata sp.]